MRYPQRNWALAAVAVGLASIGGALLACEVYLRLFSTTGCFTPSALKKISLEYDVSIRLPILPQKEQDVFDYRSRSILHVNKLGYRGHDFNAVKPKDAIRIIIYGGSQVFDAQEEDWPHRVERIILKAGFPKAEVINAGIPGDTAYGSFERLFTEGHTFGPDYVILDSAWNDLAYFDTKKSLLRSDGHKFSVTNIPGHNLTSDPMTNYWGTLDRLLCNMSQLYVRLRYRYIVWKYNVGDEGQKPSGRPSSEISDIALKQYRLNIEMFVDCARNIGAVPILMTQPRLVNQRNTESEKKRIHYDYQPLTPKALCDALSKIDEIIFAVAKEKKVPVIDASSEMTGKSDFFVDHIHFSANGSQKVSEIVARALVRILNGDADRRTALFMPRRSK